MPTQEPLTDRERRALESYVYQATHPEDGREPDEELKDLKREVVLDAQHHAKNHATDSP